MAIFWSIRCDAAPRYEELLNAPITNNDFSTKFWPKIKLVGANSSDNIDLKDEVGRWS